MLRLLKLGLSEYVENHVFGSFNLNNSEKHRLSFEDIFFGTLDTYTKKINPPSAVLGGVHGKVCWLIAYMCMLFTLIIYNNVSMDCRYSSINIIFTDAVTDHNVSTTR